jgi:cation transporter-like permease
MERQRHFPPKGWVTRRVFIGVIVALTVALLLGSVFGPIFTATDPDPRPWVALLSVVTYVAMFAMVFWIVWFVLKPRQSTDRRSGR